MDGNRKGEDESLDDFFKNETFQPDDNEWEKFLSEINNIDATGTLNDIFTDQEEEASSSFVQAQDEPYIEQEPDILNLLEAETEAEPLSQNGFAQGAARPDLDTDENELASIMSGFSELNGEDLEEADEKVTSNPVRKKLSHRMKDLFDKKELTEEQLLLIQQEEEEERQYEEVLQEKKSVKKKEKRQIRQALKEEREKKNQVKAEQKTILLDKKKEEKKKKQQEKFNKRADGVPRSQIVSIRPAIAVVIIGMSFFFMFVLLTEMKFYKTSITSSKEYFIHQNYDDAYTEILGLKIQKKDQEFYKQARIIRMLDKEKKAYEQYMEIGKYPEALEALVGGISKYEENKEEASSLGLEKEFQRIYEEMVDGLRNTFEISVDEAKALNGTTNKKNYDTMIRSIADKPVQKENQQALK